MPRLDDLQGTLLAVVCNKRGNTSSRDRYFTRTKQPVSWASVDGIVEKYKLASKEQLIDLLQRWNAEAPHIQFSCQGGVIQTVRIVYLEEVQQLISKDIGAIRSNITAGKAQCLDAVYRALFASTRNAVDHCQYDNVSNGEQQRTLHESVVRQLAILLQGLYELEHSLLKLPAQLEEDLHLLELMPGIRSKFRSENNVWAKAPYHLKHARARAARLLQLLDGLPYWPEGVLEEAARPLTQSEKLLVNAVAVRKDKKRSRGQISQEAADNLPVLRQPQDKLDQWASAGGGQLLHASQGDAQLMHQDAASSLQMLIQQVQEEAQLGSLTMEASGFCRQQQDELPQQGSQQQHDVHTGNSLMASRLQQMAAAALAAIQHGDGALAQENAWPLAAPHTPYMQDVMAAFVPDDSSTSQAQLAWLKPAVACVLQLVAGATPEVISQLLASNAGSDDQQGSVDRAWALYAETRGSAEVGGQGVDVHMASAHAQPHSYAQAAQAPPAATGADDIIASAAVAAEAAIAMAAVAAVEPPLAATAVVGSGAQAPPQHTDVRAAVSAHDAIDAQAAVTVGEGHMMHDAAFEQQAQPSGEGVAHAAALGVDAVGGWPEDLGGPLELMDDWVLGLDGVLGW